jgi:ligand-binding SRPBCC domain-containing protein
MKPYGAPSVFKSIYWCLTNDSQTQNLCDTRLRLYGLPIAWRARITNWNPPYRFVDEQIQGPYKLWVHIHRFYEQNGNTEIVDEVWYQLPLWPLGEIAYPLVAAQLQRIFRFRKQAIWMALSGER